MDQGLSIIMFVILILFFRFSYQSKSAGGCCTESGILKINDDYVPQQFRQNCERIIPYPERVENAEWYGSFIYLKTEFQSLGFYNLSLNEL